MAEILYTKLHVTLFLKSGRRHTVTVTFTKPVANDQATAYAKQIFQHDGINLHIFGEGTGCLIPSMENVELINITFQPVDTE